jgi:hypothetical protein
VTTTSDRRKRDENREHHDESAAPTEDEIQARLAAAWDEGFTAGFYDPLAGWIPPHDASESTRENPYDLRGGGS